MVELEPEAQDQTEKIETRLRDQLRLKTDLVYRLEFHYYGTLPRY